VWLIRTRANRQPALAVYRRETEMDAYRAWGIWVLTTDGDAIAEVTAHDDHVADTVFAQRIDLTLQDWFSRYRHHALGAIVGVGVEAAAHAGGDDDGFHVGALPPPSFHMIASILRPTYTMCTAM